MANSGKKIVYDPTTKRHLVEKAPEMITVEEPQPQEAPLKVEPVRTEKHTKKKRGRPRGSKTKKPAQPTEPTLTKFPTEGKVNKYGFIYLDNNVLAAWGLNKGTEQRITIDLQEGTLIIRKA